MAEQRPDRLSDETREPGEPLTPKKPKKKKKDDEPVATEQSEGEAEQPEDVLEPPDSEAASEEPDEVEIRTIAAEAAFRKRVELAELRDLIGGKAYAALREEHGPGLHWYLEEGPVLLRAVVAETESAAGPVRKAAIKYAVSRETEPPHPIATLEKVCEALAKPFPAGAVAERAGAAAPVLSSETAVEAVVETEDRGPVLVVIEEGAVTVHETASPESPVLERRLLGPTAERPSAAPSGKSRGSDGVRPSREPANTPAEGSDEPSVAADMPVSPEAAERLLRTVADGPEPPRPDSDFAKALEAAELAWIERRLPPISGGAPEADEVLPAERTGPVTEEVTEAPPDRPREERPDERKERPPVPPESPGEDPFRPSASPVEQPRKRSRRSRPSVRLPDISGGPGPEGLPPLPDAAARRKARRMLRKLAARFGLKLTPDLEGYLMQIVFRLRYVDGRLRRGIGVNVDVLLRIMEALRSHYPLYARRRPS